MKSKYVDISSIVQVIGSIYNNPDLLEQKDKYFFNEEDFPEEFHKIVFGAMYNLYALGAKKIDLITIEDYLSQRPKKMAIYKANKGAEYLKQVSKSTQLAAFDYYYSRMKKMTLLRMYDNVGLNVSWIYDPDNIMDIKKKQKQEEWLDNTPIEEIADIIDKKIIDIRLKYVDDAEEKASQAGKGILELLQRLKETPEVGYPLYGDLINEVTRGARFKKFYLRSAPQGAGKTRAIVADACFIGCNEIYDLDENKWIENGTKEPTLFITTEQEIEEIQTLMIAFLSGVDEEHILKGYYEIGEWERVVHAAELIKQCPIYIQELHDFSLQDIENTLKRGIRDFGVKYLFNYGLCYTFPVATGVAILVANGEA